MAKAKSKLKNVVLDEVSFVGKGDNPEAHITLLKVKKQYVQSITSVKKDHLPDGDGRIDLLKDWADERPDALTKAVAESFFEILQDRQVRDLIWDMVWTLEDSIYSIMNDDSVMSKSLLIAETVDQFREAITTITKGEKQMSKKIEDQLKEAEEALTKTKTDLESVTKERDDLLADITVLKEKVPADEVTIDKSKLPTEVVKQLEKQEQDLKKQADDLKILKEENTMRAIVTKAASLTHIGPVEDVTKVLKSISSLDDDAHATIFELLKTADKRIKESSLLGETGDSLNTSGSDAYEAINKEAQKLMEQAPDLTKEQAFVKVYQSNAELRKAYNEETSS